MTTSTRTRRFCRTTSLIRRADHTIHPGTNLPVLLLVSVATLCVILPASAEQSSVHTALAPFSAEYDIKVAGVTVGKLIRRYEIDSRDRYVFSSTSESSGIAALFQENSTNESSRGQITDSVFTSKQYSRTRRKGKKTKTETVDFDFDEGIAIKSRRGATQKVMLTTPSFDPLSYQLQLMHDLYLKKSELAYNIHSAKKLKLYGAETDLIESVETPYSTLSAVKVIQQTSDGKKTTFWCAETLGFLPVKVTIEEDDRTTTIVLKAYVRLTAADLSHESEG